MSRCSDSSASTRRRNSIWWRRRCGGIRRWKFPPWARRLPRALALERVHAANHEFVLHFDVDMIHGEEFPWTNFPGTGGLSLNEVRDALRVFAAQPNLAAIDVAGYNPDLDPDGEGARTLIDLLADVLSTRLEAASSAARSGASRSMRRQFPRGFQTQPTSRTGFRRR